MSKKTPPAGRAPQRERGRQRVAALLEAASAVFAEKGYAAATMTEIAMRAGAPIGSLYQFFPNKELLADALLQRFREHADAALAAIEARAAQMPSPELADALLDVLIDLRDERETALALFDARSEEANRPVMRGALRRHVTRIVKAHAPRLTAARQERVATVLHYQMKTAATICVAEGGPRSAALAELRGMVRDYLTRAAAAA